MEVSRSRRMETAAQLAQIVGAIAIVVSLIYVGSEIRQNTAAIQLSNQQSALGLGHEWDAWLREVGFAEAYVQANTNYSLVSAVQRVQVDTWIGEGFNIWEFVFASRATGLVEDELFDAWDRFFAGEIRQKEAWRRAWPEKRHAYATAFQAHVEAILSGL